MEPNPLPPLGGKGGLIDSIRGKDCLRYTLCDFVGIGGD